MIKEKTEESKIISLHSKPAWNAVCAIALGVSGLITAEFLPVSLLTPMAKDLVVTEGIAGQAISVTAVVAMVSSLFIAVVTGKMDRRWVLLAFTVLQILSNVMVAYALNFAILLVGRVLLGIGLGGFWSMAGATALRLVPQHLVSKALSIVYGAVSVAAVIAAPLGSYLGGQIGWRNVFLIAAVIGIVALIWQVFTIPSMPTEKPASLKTLTQVINRPLIKGGMVASLFVYMGYSAFFTYLRPFLENVTHVGTQTLSIMLLGFGLANMVGTTLARFPLDWNIHRSLTITPFVMGMLVICLIIFGHNILIAAVLLALWALVYSVVQVGWVAWITRTVPDEAESAGGLQVAVIQLAITLGAAFGGFIFDYSGATGVYFSSTVFTLLASLVAFLAFNQLTWNKKKLQTGQPIK